MGRNEISMQFSWRCVQVMLGIAMLATWAAADGRRPVVNPRPEYPEIAKQLKISGSVKVELVIAADGTIKNMKILGGHPVLVEAVQKALKQWKYAPSATESTMQLDFKFD